MRQIMHDLAGRLGVSDGDARLLRLTNNAVFALPAAGLVVRITRSHGLRERVRKVAGLAEWFAQVDAPAIRLAEVAVTQPIEVGDLLATVWHYLPSSTPPLAVADLGVVLREFHQLGRPPVALPVWDPVSDVRVRLADAEALPDKDRVFLLDWCDRLAPRIADLNARVSGRLVHGDAHVGNLLRDPAGRVVMCDFDAACVGPWQVDLVAVPVGEARFGRKGAHAALSGAYGYDVVSDADWPLLREARELKMVAAAVPLLASAPGVAEEFAVRLRSIADGDEQARWTPFADLTPGGRSLPQTTG